MANGKWKNKRAKMANKVVKPFAMFTRTFGAPRALAHGYAMFAQRPLRTKCCLPGRYVKK